MLQIISYCTQTGHMLQAISFVPLCFQVRAALLEEVQLSLQALVHSKGFTVGIAAAISSHLCTSLVNNARLPGSDKLAGQLMLLDHIRLLEVGPLRALLRFLWLQLGFRWFMSPLRRQAVELIAVTTASTLSGWTAAFVIAQLHSTCMDMDRHT